MDTRQITTIITLTESGESLILRVVMADLSGE